MTISFVRHQFPLRLSDTRFWLYVRFTLSYRDVEDLLAERGLDVYRPRHRARDACDARVEGHGAGIAGLAYPRPGTTVQYEGIRPRPREG
jgi:hypothetical protein